MNPKRRSRRCLCCRELFVPDPRNRHHQRFCSADLCQGASKALSQKRWLAKAANKDHWRGAAQVERVRLWRKAHPRYWKRSDKTGAIALQDVCPSDPIETEELKPDLAVLPLQENCFTQDPLIVGLISMLTASPLQEDIALTHRRLVAKGHEILGITPATHLKKYDEQKTPGAGAAAPDPQPV